MRDCPPVLFLTCGAKNVEGALFCRPCGGLLAGGRSEPRDEESSR
jgi:hypothetical protein